MTPITKWPGAHPVDNGHTSHYGHLAQAAPTGQEPPPSASQINGRVNHGETGLRKIYAEMPLSELLAEGDAGGDYAEHMHHELNARGLMHKEALALVSQQATPPALAKAEPNENYARFAGPYGTVTGAPTNLAHYPYHGKAADADALVARHGYKTYLAHGRYGMPDLNRRNYDTGHIMVPMHDETGDFHADNYTKTYRQLHGLAHALTLPEVNKTYGDGKRVGAMGKELTPHEAMRAVHWAWLAAHKQRELGAQMGIHVPDETFNRELNTAVHHTLHRSLTGQSVEPSSVGFQPSTKKPDLAGAFDVIRDEAARMGINHPHAHQQTSLMRSEAVILPGQGSSIVSDKTYSRQEVTEILKKTAVEKITALEAEITELRKRETAKALGHANPTTANTDPAGVGGGSGNVSAMSQKTGVAKGEPEEETSSPERSSHEETYEKAEVVSHSGEHKSLGDQPSAVMPEDKTKKVKAEGSGGQVKSLKALQKAALCMKDTKKAELLTKPPVSEAQRRAMGAAAGGNSSLGIPKSVGKEFINADAGGKLPAKKSLPKVAKSQPPMAKPPSGTNMATKVPVSKGNIFETTPNGGEPGVAMAEKNLDKAALPAAPKQMQQHMLHDASAAAKPQVFTKPSDTPNKPKLPGAGSPQALSPKTQSPGKLPVFNGPGAQHLHGTAPTGGGPAGSISVSPQDQMADVNAANLKPATPPLRSPAQMGVARTRPGIFGRLDLKTKPQ